MTVSERARRVHEYLRGLYPNPQCALRYTRDYELLLAVIMSAQTTDRQVNRVTAELFRKYPTLADYRRSDLATLEQDISSIGLYRAKARNIQKTSSLLLDKFDGRVPRTLAEITECPGAARKTANVVLWELYGLAEGIAVDTHVRRLARQLRLTTHLDPAKIERDLMRLFPRAEWGNVSHRFILYGREYWPARQADRGGLAKTAAVSPIYR